MTARFRHRVVLGLKQLLYGRTGEPYQLDEQTLRYVPGTRPIRSRYTGSPNSVNRYDALQVAWLRDHLSEGDTAVDIGAHYGTLSVLMAARCGQSGTVVAFEPDPYAREVLAENLKLNPKIKRPTIEVCACSDEVGEATLFSLGGNSNSSLAEAALGASMQGKSESIQVPVVTLDFYLALHNLPVPCCVKIDAEGAEIRILKGATRVLSSDAAVLCELHPYAWPEFGNTLAELKYLAAATGRRIRYLDQNTEMADPVQYGTVLLERSR